MKKGLIEVYSYSRNFLSNVKSLKNIAIVLKKLITGLKAYCTKVPVMTSGLDRHPTANGSNSPNFINYSL